MSDNAYSEFVNVEGSSVQVFAMRLDGDKLVWSISSTTGGVGATIGDSSEQAVKSLKQLKQQINGAIKFFNDKQKEINDETQK